MDLDVGLTSSRRGLCRQWASQNSRISLFDDELSRAGCIVPEEEKETKKQRKQTAFFGGKGEEREEEEKRDARSDKLTKRRFGCLWSGSRVFLFSSSSNSNSSTSVANKEEEGNQELERRRSGRSRRRARQGSAGPVLWDGSKLQRNASAVTGRNCGGC